MATSIPSSSCLRALRIISHDTPHASQLRNFSCSSQLQARRRRKDGNKLRGLSVMRASGPIEKKIRSIKASQLPIPVTDRSKIAQIERNEEHGLMKFFNDGGESVTSPEKLMGHGRAWTKTELHTKSVQDLNIIWWKVHFEMNRLATELGERERLKPGMGEYELNQRKDVLAKTQENIRKALQERYEAWQEAQDIVNNDQDPDIMVNDDGDPVEREREAVAPYEEEELESIERPAQGSQVAPS